MDRYSTIIGTIASGAEMRLAESAGLAKFLQSQGALDANIILQVVNSQLREFELLSGYEAEMRNQKPVAVRYAPMHLYKMQGMEKMEKRPFCAMCVNGMENREDRISKYSQTFVFSHQQMRQGKDGYNYLDMLFGMELLSWQTLEQYRNGQTSLECDTQLRKVTPRIEMRDLAAVLKTVEAIYEGENVVIRLEPGFSFNDRAMSLLAGIYSLIQPRFAAEVGYATYQRPADIAEIVKRNSIRIFVLPAGESLDQIPESYLILDMAKPPVRLKKSPLMSALVNWIQIPWELRQRAMQKLFEGEAKYTDMELFIQKSEAFFSDMRSVDKWNLDTSKDGTLSSLEELCAEYEAQASYGIPWFEQMFRDKIGKLIGKQTTLEKLNAQTAVKLFTATGNEQQQARKVYLFGRKFGNVDIGELCQLVSTHQKLQDDQVHSVEIAALDAALDKAKKESVTALQQAKAEAATALDAEQENTRRAVEAGNAAVEAEQKKAAAALTAEQENTRRAVEAGNAAVEEEQKKAAAALAAEQEGFQIALEAEKANTRKAIEEGEAAVTIEQKKTAAVQKEKESLRAKAVAALNEERKRTQEAQTALEQEKEWHEQTRETVQKLEEQTKILQQSLQQKQKNADELSLILNKTKQERADAIGKIADAENKVKNAEADRQRMATERDEALRTEADAQKKLDDYIHGKYNKKLIAIGGLAGLLAGVAIIGAFWICMSLFKQPAPVPPNEPVVETVGTELAATTAPTIETQASTIETQVPTMETLPQNTDCRIDTEALGMLQADVPTLGVVETENLEVWIPETLQLEAGDIVLALLSTAEVLPEEPGASEFSYALLIEHSTPVQETEAGVAETSEHTTGVVNESVYVSADLKISTGLYDLVVFGDETMQYAAIRAFDFLIPEEVQTTYQWSNRQLEPSGQDIDVGSYS